MVLRKWWRLAVLTVLATGAASAAHYHVTRAPCRTSLPGYDYRTAGRSASVLAMSHVVIPVLPGPLAASDGKRILLLQQFEPAPLAVDHCSISEVAVQLYQEKDLTRAVLSLRAAQNPGVPPYPAPVTGPMVESNAEKFTLHLRRNEFHVKVRLFANYKSDTAVPGAEPGEPVVFTLEPPPFWVQRGEPYALRWECNCTEIARYFDYVDRAELEFYYR